MIFLEVIVGFLCGEIWVFFMYLFYCFGVDIYYMECSVVVYVWDYLVVYLIVCIIDICFIDGLGLKKEECFIVEVVDLWVLIFGGVFEVFCLIVSYMCYLFLRLEGIFIGGVF